MGLVNVNQMALLYPNPVNECKVAGKRYRMENVVATDVLLQ